MPGPTDPPYEWATDASHPAGPEPWAAQPNKVDPGATRKAEGFYPGLQPSAEEMNHVLGRMCEWISYLASFVDETADELVYPSIKALSIPIPPSSLIQGAGFARDAPDLLRVYSTADGGKLFLDFSRFPVGSEIADVEVMVEPGAARAGANRMYLEWSYATPDLLGPPFDVSDDTLSSTVYDDTTANRQTLTISPNYTVTETEIAGLMIAASGTDAAANRDTVHWIVVYVNAPSPKAL